MTRAVAVGCKEHKINGGKVGVAFLGKRYGKSAAFTDASLIRKFNRNFRHVAIMIL